MSFYGQVVVEEQPFDITGIYLHEGKLEITFGAPTTPELRGGTMHYGVFDSAGHLVLRGRLPFDAEEERQEPWSYKIGIELGADFSEAASVRPGTCPTCGQSVGRNTRLD